MIEMTVISGVDVKKILGIRPGHTRAYAQNFLMTFFLRQRREIRIILNFKKFHFLKTIRL